MLGLDLQQREQVDVPSTSDVSQQYESVAADIIYASYLRTADAAKQIAYDNVVANAGVLGATDRKVVELDYSTMNDVFLDALTSIEGDEPVLVDSLREIISAQTAARQSSKKRVTAIPTVLRLRNETDGDGGVINVPNIRRMVDIKNSHRVVYDTTLVPPTHVVVDNFDGVQATPMVAEETDAPQHTYPELRRMCLERDQGLSTVAEQARLAEVGVTDVRRGASLLSFIDEHMPAHGLHNHLVNRVAAGWSEPVVNHGYINVAKPGDYPATQHINPLDLRPLVPEVVLRAAVQETVNLRTW